MECWGTITNGILDVLLEEAEDNMKHLLLVLGGPRDSSQFGKKCRSMFVGEHSGLTTGKCYVLKSKALQGFFG